MGTVKSPRVATRRSRQVNPNPARTQALHPLNIERDSALIVRPFLRCPIRRRPQRYWTLSGKGELSLRFAILSARWGDACKG